LSEEHHPEIVIVRRHPHRHDDHHGGAWKIAFADFMTAMMALFLVLWLISSTSEKQRRAVAQYFNPVRLVDMTTLKKGFHDPKESEMGAGSETDRKASDGGDHESKQRAAEPSGGRAKDEKGAPRASGKQAKNREGPISEVSPAKLKVVTGVDAGRPGVGRSEPVPAELAAAFADPFATLPGEPPPADEPAEIEAYRSAPAGSPQGAEIAGPDPRNSRRARAGADSSGIATPDPSASEGDADVEALTAEILGGAKPAADQHAAPRLEIRMTDEGILISLTDDVDDMMFAIGSADPQRRTVEMLRKIAQSLSARPGAIVVRGHTDSRPYRPGTSDNWRLSTSRAHSAREVLVRSGLAEARIERVEGYADKSLKVVSDPHAPENRRIEILLRKAAE
jgi:chemotaxis protein MotB